MASSLSRVPPVWPRPRPEIIESGGERTLGYHDSLVLPIRVAPAHPGEPVTIRAMVDLGVCLDICVPVQVTLEAGPPGPAPDPRIEAALALGIGRNTITRKIHELGLDGGGEEGAHAPA